MESVEIRPGRTDTIPWMVPAAVRLFSRQACGLCDEARAVIQAERERGAGFGFEEVFVDGDPGLESRYGLRVPVVEIDGREAFEYAVEPVRFRALVSH